MTSTYSALALRMCLGLSALVAPTMDTGQLAPWWHGSAFAQSAGESEKEAFEAAKELGTVEAWDAFLSNYPTGFHADLARAYVKQLADQTPAPSPSPSPTAPAISANDDFPAVAGSWGGVVRDGPGKQYRKVDSLNEGEPVTLMGRSDVIEDGFPWFKISYRDGRIGYKWGGILCSTGAERPDLFKTCPVEPPRKTETKEKPHGCKNGGEWDGLRCRPAGFFDKAKKRCHGRETYIPETGRCVDLEAQEDQGGGDLNNPPPRKKCPAGQYRNQNGVCQPNETGQ
jgi:hypothetical protein